MVSCGNAPYFSISRIEYSTAVFTMKTYSDPLAAFGSRREKASGKNLIAVYHFFGDYGILFYYCKGNGRGSGPDRR